MQLSDAENELIDIFDNGGTRIGTVHRGQAHREALWHRAVHVWVMTSEGQVVFQKRSREKIAHPGKWDISVGGHVRAEDTLVEAACREVREELGLTIGKDELFPLTSLTQTFDDDRIQFHDREFVSVYLLKRRVVVSELRPAPEEVEGLREVDPRTLQHLDSALFVPHQEEYEFLWRYLGSPMES